jgi:hypothetical protein
MLSLGEKIFAIGRSRFEDKLPTVSEETAKLYVRVRFKGSERHFFAQLDTGAAWSVLDSATAELIGAAGQKGVVTSISTRFGMMQGTLVRIPLTFEADEGESLELEGTFFLCPDWPPGRLFLGYGGLLERIRFAADPQANHFYFGPPGPSE